MKKFISVMLILSLCLTTVNGNAYENLDSNSTSNVTDVVESLKNCTKQTRSSWIRTVVELLASLGAGAGIGKKFNKINKEIHAYDAEDNMLDMDESEPSKKIGFWKWLFGGLFGGRPEGQHSYVPGVFHIPFCGGGSNVIRVPLYMPLGEELLEQQLPRDNPVTQEALGDAIQVLRTLRRYVYVSEEIDEAVRDYVVRSTRPQVINYMRAVHTANTREYNMGPVPDVLIEVIRKLKERRDQDGRAGFIGDITDLGQSERISIRVRADERILIDHITDGATVNNIYTQETFFAANGGLSEVISTLTSLIVETFQSYRYHSEFFEALTDETIVKALLEMYGWHGKTCMLYDIYSLYMLDCRKIRARFIGQPTRYASMSQCEKDEVQSKLSRYILYIYNELKGFDGPREEPFIKALDVLDKTLQANGEVINIPIDWVRKLHEGKADPTLLRYLVRLFTSLFHHFGNGSNVDAALADKGVVTGVLLGLFSNRKAELGRIMCYLRDGNLNDCFTSKRWYEHVPNLIDNLRRRVHIAYVCGAVDSKTKNSLSQAIKADGLNIWPRYTWSRDSNDDLIKFPIDRDFVEYMPTKAELLAYISICLSATESRSAMESWCGDYKLGADEMQERYRLTFRAYFDPRITDKHRSDAKLFLKRLIDKEGGFTSNIQSLIRLNVLQLRDYYNKEVAESEEVSQVPHAEHESD